MCTTCDVWTLLDDARHTLRTRQFAFLLYTTPNIKNESRPLFLTVPRTTVHSASERKQPPPASSHAVWPSLPRPNLCDEVFCTVAGQKKSNKTQKIYKQQTNGTKNISFSVLFLCFFVCFLSLSSFHSLFCLFFFSFHFSFFIFHFSFFHFSFFFFSLFSLFPLLFLFHPPPLLFSKFQKLFFEARFRYDFS